MHKNKIKEYRAAAAACEARAAEDPTKSQRWLEVAAEWSKMADELESTMNPGGN